MAVETPKIPRTSKEYLYVPKITAFSTTSGEVDPTTLTVEMTLLPTTQAVPAESDWVAASWAPGAETATARVLVGPGTDLVKSVGEYNVWVRVHGAVEQPERPVGKVKIT